MRFRAYAVGTALAVATTFGGGAILTALDSPSAMAARPAPPHFTGATTCNVTPTGSDTVQEPCSVNITSVAVVNHELVAAGTFTSTDPVTQQSFTTQFSNALLDPPAGCSILSLTLGPLHLDLLGLVVDIPNPIVLNITAVPGAGNLLGNLLCTVANLLNNTGAGGALTNLINQINTILAGV